MKPVADKLAEHFPGKVTFATDLVGEDAHKKVAALKDGEIVLLENTRFDAGEEKNSEELCRKLADFCDIYVNDAFGTAHRAHASTAGIGLAIGAGMYPIGIATTIIIILMQTIMHKFNIGNDALATRDINITMNDTPELRDAFLAELKRMDVSVIGSHITHNNDGTVNYGLTIKFSREIKFEEILAFMDSPPGIRNIAM